MCGRYRRSSQEEELARIFQVPIPDDPVLPISWNIAPSQPVTAIRWDNDQARPKMVHFRWGLIPHWSKDTKIGYRTINARSETVDRTPAFRQAYEKRRCLILANGFYEWRKKSVPKAPFQIQLKSDEPFAFAGVWETWRDPENGNWVRSCAILTTSANRLVGEIHDRMPVILRPKDHERWLRSPDLASLRELLAPFPDAEMAMWEISDEVNSPRHNEPGLIVPVTQKPLKFTRTQPELF